jgi:cold-inducible RNA-binding protein
MTKLFVGGLPYSTTQEELQDMFTQFGSVLSAAIIMDRMTNRSKGFGFVEMDSDEAAQEAISKLDGSDFGGRKLAVSVARPKEDRPRNDFNNRGGNGGGGFNRDSRGGGNRGGYSNDRRGGGRY